MEGSIFAKSELLTGTETFDEIFFLVIALKPYLPIGMIVGEGLKERGRAFTMEIDGTDYVTTGSKVDGLEVLRRKEEAI